MSAYRGVLATVPGRVTVRVHLPDDLLTEADRMAAERGTDRAVVLGDLVADALPDALAEAARNVLAPQLPQDAATASDRTDAVAIPHMTFTQVDPTVPGAGRSDATDGPGAIV